MQPSAFALKQWREARRLPEDPENPPKDGDPNPFGDWEKISTKILIKKYGARDKAPAFCPPKPEYILIKAFKEIEKAGATATAYKAAMDTMADVGASMNAFLLAAEPVI